MRQFFPACFNLSYMVPLANEKPPRTVAVPGESVSPPEVAAWMKKRFGHVGPGNEECQKLKTANCWANVESTGNEPAEKYSMTRWRSFGTFAAVAAVSAEAIKPFMTAGFACGIGRPG